jgi:uncharacterized iron-regulated membrane protein
MHIKILPFGELLGLLHVMTVSGCMVWWPFYQTLDLPGVSEAHSLTAALISLTVLAVKCFVWIFSEFYSL